MSTHYCSGTSEIAGVRGHIIAYMGIDADHCYAMFPQAAADKWLVYRIKIHVTDNLPKQYTEKTDITISEGNNSRFMSIIRASRAASAMAILGLELQQEGPSVMEEPRVAKMLQAVCVNQRPNTFIIRPTAITTTRQVINLREISIASIINRFYSETEQFAGLFACKFVKNAPTWLSGSDIARNVVMLEVRIADTVDSGADKIYLALLALTVIHSCRIIHGDPTEENLIMVSDNHDRKDVLTWKSYEEYRHINKERYVYSVLQNYRQSFVDIESDMLEKYVPDNPTFHAACVKDLRTLLDAVNAPKRMKAFEFNTTILPTLQILEHFYARIDLE